MEISEITQSIIFKFFVRVVIKNYIINSKKRLFMVNSDNHSIRCDNDLWVEAKKRHVNIRKILQDGLRLELCVADDPMEHIVSERLQLMKERETLVNDLDKKIKACDERIKILESHEHAIETIRMNPLVQQSIEFVKNHPQTLEPRIRLIHAQTGHLISKTQMLMWMNEKPTDGGDKNGG